ncbi:MAG: hypothetical protein KY475_10065 [Planctomycetes bacterium]|nr:hypothetical protein [Planctomycetota bacterium]
MHRRLFLASALVWFAGCERREPESRRQSFQQDRYEGALVIAVDLSGSFADFVTENGRAYQILLKAVDRYFRDRIGSDSMILITQLSGNADPLLWQGTPEQLRRQFPDHRAFRDFLLSRADPSASRINDGVAESLNCAVRTLRGSEANAAALILTDWEDTYPDQDASRDRLTRALRDFSQYGSLGLYFCSNSRIPDVERLMDETGVSYVLVGSYDHNPPLPSFDW